MYHGFPCCGISQCVTWRSKSLPTDRNCDTLSIPFSSQGYIIYILKLMLSNVVGLRFIIIWLPVKFTAYRIQINETFIKDIYTHRYINRSKTHCIILKCQCCTQMLVRSVGSGGLHLGWNRYHRSHQCAYSWITLQWLHMSTMVSPKTGNAIICSMAC